MKDLDFYAFMIEDLQRRTTRWIEEATQVVKAFHAEQTKALGGTYAPSGLFECQRHLARATIGNSIQRQLAKISGTEGLVNGIKSLRKEATEQVMKVARYGSRSTDPFFGIVERLEAEVWSEILEITAD